MFDSAPKFARCSGFVFAVCALTASLAGCGVEAPGEELSLVRSAGEKGDSDTKEEVCHSGQTISVGRPAVPAHLRHGDTLGTCPLDCSPESCDDGDSCTSDSCAADGSCWHAAVSCDDGNSCTTDSCRPDTGCVATTVVGCCSSEEDCEDGDACTEDRCVGGGCTNERLGGACDPDVCVDGTTREVACGANGSGTQRQICTAGDWAWDARPVDVILVADNSSSMEAAIGSLTPAINGFASQLGGAGVDYRVIVFSLYGDGNVNGSQAVCVPPPLGSGLCSSPLVNNPPIFFQYSVRVGSTRPWCQLVSAFEAPDELGLAPNGWSEWLRPEAFKHFVIVTDDNSSCIPPAPFATFSGLNGAANIDSALLSLSPAQFGTPGDRHYMVHSIVGVPSGSFVREATDPLVTTACTNSLGLPVPSAGSVHQQLSIDTGGARYSVCNLQAFDAYLGDLGARLFDQSGACADAGE